MALRDQPYLPLYVQDFLTDEKLMECSASATGIYIRLMCIMHKSDEYGVILLKQKDKQTDNQIKNFALKLAKHLPYSTEEIINGLSELINEDVLQLNCEKIYQKRMIRDNEISLVRSKAGKKGGDNNPFAQAKIQAKEEAKPQANSENESAIVIDYEFIVENYHSLCPKLNKVQVINEIRKGFMNARVGEYGIEKVISVLRLAGECEFLNGQNDKAWKADFEWIMRPVNFVKIMEGKYTNNKAKKQNDVFAQYGVQ